MNVELGLQVEPELGAGAEENTKSKGGFRTDGALALYDFINRRAGNPGAFGQCGLGEVESLQKFLFEDASRRCAKNGWCGPCGGHDDNG